MEGSLVKFGDVFRHREKEYVFLAQTVDVVYAALILDEIMTEKFQKISDIQETKLTTRRKTAAFSFVILRSEAFKGRAAHLAKTDNSEHQATRFDLITSLNKEDCLQIKNEILSEDSPVSLQLISIVKDLNIS